MRAGTLCEPSLGLIAHVRAHSLTAASHSLPPLEEIPQRDDLLTLYLLTRFLLNHSLTASTAWVRPRSETTYLLTHSLLTHTAIVQRGYSEMS